ASPLRTRIWKGSPIWQAPSVKVTGPCRIFWREAESEAYGRSLSMNFPAIKAVSYALAHTPDLVRYGSKPERELRKEPELSSKMAAHLRTFEEVCAYPPNQVFIGGVWRGGVWEKGE